MRNPYVAALVGALACVSAEAVVIGAFEPPGAGDLTGWILVCAVWTGPGAFLLAIPYAHALENELDGGAPAGRVLALGTLCGAPVGLVNVTVTLLAHAGPSMIGGGFSLGRRSIPLLAIGLFGGAALGLGCALALLRSEDASE